MLRQMKKILTQSINDKNFMILGFELFLFSALYGVAFHSWVVFGVMFLGLSWLLNRPRGTAYMICAVSLFWCFIAFSIGYSISWGWAAVLGGAFFILGITAHVTGLKRPLVSKLVLSNQNHIEWRRNGYPRQNFN